MLFVVVLACFTYHKMEINQQPIQRNFVLIKYVNVIVNVKMLILLNATEEKSSTHKVWNVVGAELKIVLQCSTQQCSAQQCSTQQCSTQQCSTQQCSGT
jgi:hypothetical protein